MATRCPRCAAVISPFAGAAADRAPFVRCQRCGAISRGGHVYGDQPGVVYGDQPGVGNGISAPAFGRRPSIRIIEGEIAADNGVTTPRRPSRARPTPRRRAGDRRLWLAGAIALALLALTAAAPAVASLLIAKKGLVLEGVSSKTITIRGAGAILVEGRLVNHADAEMTVPAIRISVRGKGEAELQAWLVEPARQRLAPLRSVAFRSIAAAPASVGHKVAVELVERLEQTAGMR